MSTTESTVRTDKPRQSRAAPLRKQRAAARATAIDAVAQYAAKRSDPFRVADVVEDTGLSNGTAYSAVVQLCARGILRRNGQRYTVAG